MSIFHADDWREPTEPTPGDGFLSALSDGTRERIGTALWRWVESNPLADRPLLYVATGGEDDGPGTSGSADDVEALTPRDIAEGFSRPGSRYHRAVSRLFEVGMAGAPGDPEDAAEQLIELFETADNAR
jgi:hypothetical protein